MLELIDVSEKSFNLVPSFADIVVKLIIDLLPTIDLRLKVLDGTIDIAQRALLGAVLALLVFEMGLEL